MNRSTYPLKLADSVKKAAQQRAGQDGVSLNDWLSMLLLRNSARWRPHLEFLKRRSAGGSPEELIRLLRQSPDVPPMPGDEID